MEAVFIRVLNMSITGSYVILAVLLVRLLLRKAPKKYAYTLWSVAGFRLCCPVSFESLFSLFSLDLFDISRAQTAPSTLTYVPQDVGYMQQPQVTVGITAANSIINDSLPAPAVGDSVNPMQILIFSGTVIWCIGMAVLLISSLANYLLLRFRLRTAIRLDGNIWQSEEVCSPFILGLIRPRIYIPYRLEEAQLRCILAHERQHLKRLDHVAKFFAFFLLTLHWFNPLCWLAFALMNRDMEMSCDEYVLGREGDSRAYSLTLLSIASNRRFPTPSPLAFGETDVNRRIKNVLRWQKPHALVTVIAIILCVCVLIGCTANPVQDEESTAGTQDILTTGEEDLGIQFGVSYITDQCNYMSPLSSYMPLYGDSGYRYYFLEDSFVMEWKETGDRTAIENVKWEWDKFPYDSEKWSEMRIFGGGSAAFPGPPYDNNQYLELSEGYFLLKNDDGISIVKHYTVRDGNYYIWSIFHLTPEDA